MVSVKKEKTAKEIISLAKSRILLRYRFFETPLVYLKITYGSDGIISRSGALEADPDVLIRQRHDQCGSVRMLAHVLFHQIFLHPFIGSSVEKKIWNLACDIAVESLVGDLFEETCLTPQSQNRRAVIQQMRRETKPFTAEKIYRYLLEMTLSRDRLEQLTELFRVDEHDWYSGFSASQNTSAESQTGKTGVRGKTDGAESQSSDDAPPQRSEGEGESGKKEAGEGYGGKSPAQSDESAISLWKQIGRKVLAAADSALKRQSAGEGGMRELLALQLSKKTDYREFLKKFASRCEVMKTSMEEFDYIFYTYGLELYEDMPLIEPLEYREDPRIRNLAIVIDTSGSVKGEEVRHFLERTFGILKERDTYHSRFEIHVIQCDAEVQRDDIIKNPEDIDALFAQSFVHGGGGTDFRPAFDYVSSLKIPELRGMLYFTDGMGKFPEKNPGWLTCFVFVNSEEALGAKAPPWALKVILEGEEVIEL